MTKFARQMHDFRRGITAIAGLLSSLRAGGVSEIWIGDSHAMCFNEERTSAALTRASEGQLVWHLGPRLMFSLSREGFPRRVRLAARLMNRISRSDSFIPVFVAGEIDVRCHLVPRSKAEGFDLSFVEEFVRQGCQLATLMGSHTVVFAVPPPPSVTCPVIPEFPTRGSIEERCEMFMDLREALITAVGTAAAEMRVVLLDATDDLMDESSGLRQELTDDGCHTNALGIQAVRRRFHGLGLQASPRQ